MSKFSDAQDRLADAQQRAEYILGGISRYATVRLDKRASLRLDFTKNGGIALVDTVERSRGETVQITHKGAIVLRDRLAEWLDESCRIVIPEGGCQACRAERDRKLVEIIAKGIISSAATVADIPSNINIYMGNLADAVREKALELRA